MRTRKQFAVNFWGSHPDLDNDDCFSGLDFDTLEEARAAFAAGSLDYSVSHIELDGPGVYLVGENGAHDPNRRARELRRDRVEWQRESAMQAGMAFGCDGYNDDMGY